MNRLDAAAMITRDQLLDLVSTAKRDIVLEYRGLTMAQRRSPKPRSARIARIRAEYSCLLMQGKVSLNRLGLTNEEAREAARVYGDTFALHMDRHRNPDSITVRKS